MDAKTFQQGCLRTETPSKPLRTPSASPIATINGQPYHPVDYLVFINRLAHGAVIASREAGELLDAVFKGPFYGKTIDLTNIREEVGDILYGLALVCEAAGTSLEIEMQRNQDKLKARYPDKFSTEAYSNRDLEAERKVLSRDPGTMLPEVDEHGNKLGEPAYNSSMTKDEFAVWFRGNPLTSSIHASIINHKDAGYEVEAIKLSDDTMRNITRQTGHSPMTLRRVLHGFPVLQYFDLPASYIIAVKRIQPA